MKVKCKDLPDGTSIIKLKIDDKKVYASIEYHRDLQSVFLISKDDWKSQKFKVRNTMIGDSTISQIRYQLMVLEKFIIDSEETEENNIEEVEPNKNAILNRRVVSLEGNDKENTMTMYFEGGVKMEIKYERIDVTFNPFCSDFLNKMGKL